MRLLPLLLGLLMLPLASVAQTTSSTASGAAAATATPPAPVPVVVISDDAGDVKMTGPNGVDLPYPGDRMKQNDIVSVTMTEQDAGFQMDIAMAGGDPSPKAPILDDIDLLVSFVHNGVGYGVQVYSYDLTSGAQFWLQQDRGNQGGWSTIDTLDGTLDSTAGTMSVFLPRRSLLDADGAMPALGRQLTDFKAKSVGAQLGFIYTNGQPVASGGKVHDEAEGAKPYDVLIGVAQTGHARLYSDRPYRSSNGEAGSFVYQVRALNTARFDDTFHLSLSDVPKGWQVTLPRPDLSIGPEDEVLVPVVVTVPFQHTHGAIVSFTLTMTSTTHAEAVGRILLGFVYTNPAQPGGHHQGLVLHSRAPGATEYPFSPVVPAGQGLLWMNTNDKDDRDEAADIPGQFNGIGSQQGNPNDLDFGTNFQWLIPLQPGLGMGLDFVMGTSGTASFTLHSALPMPGASVDGALYVMPADPYAYLSPDQPAVATLARSDPQDIGANGDASFTVAITPTALGDYVPYDPTMNLYLVLNVTSQRPATLTTPEAPTLRAGGTLTLPLAEYQDHVEDVFASLSTLSLRALDGSERVVAPGAATVFEVELTAEKEGTYDLHAIGPHAKWIVFSDGNTFEIGKEGRDVLRVGVEVPSNATAGELVDLVLEVTSKESANATGIQLLRVTVDPTAPTESVSNQAPSHKKSSPGPAAMWVGMALLVVAAGKRGRRQG